MVFPITRRSSLEIESSSPTYAIRSGFETIIEVMHGNLNASSAPHAFSRPRDNGDSFSLSQLFF
jgi:hypothetical protein